LRLKGWLRTSLIDYPDHIATVLFTGGCNFRCPMCHNADLVLRPEALPDLPEAAVWESLRRRAGLVDGVVVSGGEPTIQPRLASFLQRVRQQGLEVKLDTNGYRPESLAVLLADGLVNYVALDVKGPPAKYALLAGRADLDLERIERSIALLRASHIPHEFRTTVVPGMLVEEDVEEIARWIAGAACYVLQPFRPLGVLDPALEGLQPYPPERLQEMARRAGLWVEQVIVRDAAVGP